MTRAERRVAIAQDVLQQLKDLSLIPGMRGWLKIKAGRLHPSQKQQLQNVLLAGDPTTPCSACALGACFVAAVRLGNECLVDPRGTYLFEDNLGRVDHSEATNMQTLLRGHFSRRQLMLIEGCFEGGFGYYKDYQMEEVLGAEQMTRWEQWVGRTYNARLPHGLAHHRMELIMQNIVQNKGTFRV